VAVALGANATFVARTHDLDRKHMQEVFRAAHEHKGASFVEIWQNCNVFNDGVFDDVLAKEQRPDMLVPLVHGQPIRFGTDDDKGVVMGTDGQLRIVDIAEVGEAALLVHDAHRTDPGLAFALAHLSGNVHSPTPFGVFRDVDRPEYAAESGRQLIRAAEQKGSGDLATLLRSNGTWQAS
jgi:2-oxoglutarate ferredoxin oxidoreductase subunit beta